ncbi:MAG: hypothetical protein GY757_48595, partial [bacterium]|nr:hypothetical protein [bacterium]
MTQRTGDTLTWLHISDLQLEENKIENIRWGSLKKDIIKITAERDLKPDVIFITGDIAASGSKKQYAVAAQYFKQLMEITGLDGSRFYVIPGNHDVQLDTVGEKQSVEQKMSRPPTTMVNV